MLRVVVLNILLAFAVVGCATSGSDPAPAQTAAIQDMVINQAIAAYRLGSGDQVRVIVFGEEDLSGEFVVDGAGMVSLPLVGEVPAGGKTLQEFRTEIETLLSDGYLTDPRVSAEVLNYRPFYILGEVEESGEYPYTDGDERRGARRRLHLSGQYARRFHQARRHQPRGRAAADRHGARDARRYDPHRRALLLGARLTIGAG